MARKSGNTYNFIDMRGQRGAGLLVGEQAASDGAGARWHVTHDRCGHDEIIHGVELRQMFKKNKSPRICRECTPKKEPL